MALGKNMKVDRIIPEKVDKQSNEIKGIEFPTIDLSLDESENKDASVEFSLDLDSNMNETLAEQKIEPLEPIVEVVQKTFYENVDNGSIKIEFTPSRRKTQKRILISIEGNLTINNVEILYSKVNDVFENYDFVEVNLKNVTAIDLTVVQLFHAIRVSYYSQKKYISINAEFSREDRKLLNTCGFTEFQTQNTAS